MPRESRVTEKRKGVCVWGERDRRREGEIERE